MNSILEILYEALEPVKDTPGELKAIQDLDQACQVLPEPERTRCGARRCTSAARATGQASCGASEPGSGWCWRWYQRGEPHPRINSDKTSRASGLSIRSPRMLERWNRLALRKRMSGSASSDTW